MRLKELKCTNCGATVKVEDNQVQAECEFCHTRFAVEDAYNYGYKFEKGRIKAHNENIEEKLEKTKGVVGTVGKVFVARSIITAVVTLFIFGIVVTSIIFLIVKQENSIDEFDINRFNNTFEIHKGTEFGSSVGRLIDEIITNNKKDKERQIKVTFKEITTKDTNEMKGIKKQLDDWTKYEVSFEYDKDGFIYLVTIEE